MVESYILLGVAALLPVVAIALFYVLAKKTSFMKLNYWLQQLIVGVVFGGLAILGTHWGIHMNGAVVNCRDGAVLVAGLCFGGPAGIIAGTIGGVERFLASAIWNVGSYTQIACSISTFIAGLYAALLRKFIFHGRRPSWLLAFAVGVVMEIFHLTMVFITNMDDTDKAMSVVKACTVPMVLFNGLSVLFSVMALNAIFKDDLKVSGEKVHLEQTVQRWLMGPIVIAFVLTSLFVYRIQENIEVAQRENLLTLATQEIVDDIDDSSNAALLDCARESKDLYFQGGKSLDEIADAVGVTEIHIVNGEGIIIDTNVPSDMDFDFNMGEQSQEFLCLLNGTQEFVQPYGPISNQNVQGTVINRKYAGIALSGGGFIQVGFDEEEFYQSISSSMKDITKNRKVGETGYMLVAKVNSAIDFDLVSAPKDIKNVESAIIALSKKNLNPNGDFFEVTANGENCFCRFDVVEGYIVIAFYPETEALKVFNVTLYVNTFMEILVFAILFFLINNIVKYLVVRNMDKVNESLAKITAGDLSEVVSVRTNQEFAVLTDDINDTVAALKEYIAEANARIDKELEFAKNIQTSALPNTFPAFPHRKDFDIYARMDTAKEVGGDFYDFYLTRSKVLNFLIADVSGKGIPGAMFMMRAKSELKSLSETGAEIADVFTNGNARLCEGNDTGLFVTAWQGKIDLTTGRVAFVNAGHNPPLVKKKDGKFEYLKSRAGLVLAGMEGFKYKEQELFLEPGDVIYLYTDGITEATDAHNELYGEERLLNALNSREFEDMREICDFVKTEVDKFVGDAPQFDDMTMLAFKFNGEDKGIDREFDADIDETQNVIGFIEDELTKHDCPMKSLIQLNVAVEEIFVNIAHYAYGNEKGKAYVNIKFKDGKVAITFRDSGTPFNPLGKKNPDITLSAEERNIGGLGIYMVKKSMDDVIYKYENDQNVLTIVKTM